MLKLEFFFTINKTNLNKTKLICLFLWLKLLQNINSKTKNSNVKNSLIRAPFHYKTSKTLIGFGYKTIQLGFVKKTVNRHAYFNLNSKLKMWPNLVFLKKIIILKKNML